MTTMTGALAISGGEPVRTAPWPPWPGRLGEAAAAATRAIQAGRWTVTGPSTGDAPLERTFAEVFAAWNGIEYCVSVDHGSTAVTMALEALGVGAGDEVIVPVLTWVASATAVLRVNAVPVFVDADPATGCLSPAAVEAVITSRTVAVLAVHLHYLMADMDQLRDICGRYGLALIEDCAQAHGAIWNGRRAGTIGDIGAFSMQQSKVLTCGEGGAVVTRDAQTYSLLQQLRSDSAGYDDGAEPGTACLSPIGDIMGTNYHLSEPQAAILLDRLPAVDAELDLRDENARYLNEQLARVPGIRPLQIPAQLQRVSVFEFAMTREEGAFGGRPTAVICDALSRELGIRVYQTDLPLHRNIRYQPWTKAAWRFLGTSRPAGGFPVAERLQENMMVLHHPALLAGRAAMDDIVGAITKVSAHAGELPRGQEGM